MGEEWEWEEENYRESSQYFVFKRFWKVEAFFLSSSSDFIMFFIFSTSLFPLIIYHLKKHC